MRQCGECTVCCQNNLLSLVDVFGFGCGSKKCEHLSASGCEIYPDRPTACAKFRCIWLQDYLVPDSLRPDRCGYVLRYSREIRTLPGVLQIVYRAPKQLSGISLADTIARYRFTWKSRILLNCKDKSLTEADVRKQVKGAVRAALMCRSGTEYAEKRIRYMGNERKKNSFFL